MKNNKLDLFINLEALNHIKNDKKNENITALVTGGCGRVGSVYTSVLLKKGINVIVLSRSKKYYNLYKSNLDSSLKDKISWEKLDLRKPKSIILLVKNLIKKKYKIKILINNASYSYRGKFFKYNQNNLDEELWGTFAGSMFLTEKILPLLRKNKNSKVIFTGSLWGNTTPRYNIYRNLDIGPSPIICAGKSAIMQYAKLLAEREASNGIMVNSLLPGWFPRKGKIERKDYMNRIKKNIPLRRIGLLNDLSSAVEFLLSDDTKYMTGQEIIIDGGYSLS